MYDIKIYLIQLLYFVNMFTGVCAPGRAHSSYSMNMFSIVCFQQLLDHLTHEEIRLAGRGILIFLFNVLIMLLIYLF